MFRQHRAIGSGVLLLFLLLFSPQSPLQVFRFGVSTNPNSNAGWSVAYDNNPGARVIYGKDDRLDIEAVSDARHLQLARSTAAMVASSDLQSIGDGESRLRGVEFGLAYNLCRDERFYSQVSAASCTGFLVAPDVIATAGHCVTSPAKCKQTAWVFSFEQDTYDRDATVVRNEDVYVCSNLIRSHLVNPTGSDWALVRLDRPVTGREPLRLRQSGQVSRGEDVFVIGHPAGLPKKFAGGAQVRNTNFSAYFVAELDTYGGNSGSPVFNATTHEVEGILVRGEVDFESNGICRRSKYCATGSCRGEDVTRISEVFGYLPN